MCYGHNIIPLYFTIHFAGLKLCGASFNITFAIRFAAFIKQPKMKTLWT